MGKRLDRQLVRLQTRRALFDALDEKGQGASKRPGSMNAHKGTGARAKR